MKINFFDDDPRLLSDKDYFLRMGSFGTVAFNMNRAFEKLGVYADAIESDWVGKCGALDPQFRYQNKKSFYINVWETNNTLPYYLLNNARNQKIFGLCDKTTNLWRKYGFEAETIYGGCDTDFWHQTQEKNKDQFIFCHINHATVRSGLDVIIPAFALKFKNNKDVKLIIKDSGGMNHKLLEFINSFKCENIEYINDFWTIKQVRDLYSKSHACINLLRSTSFGMPLLESSACNSLCICGDVSPTNELVDSSYAMMIKPKGEIPIYPFINQVEQEVGLKNYYGYFEYPENPYFWDFDIETVAQSLSEVYNNWSLYEKMDKVSPIKYNWKWEDSAKKLINILSKYEMAS
jgi:glycosyltransferase involved in cell wall biosynthesis